MATVNSYSIRFDQRNAINTAYTESFVSGSNLVLGTDANGVVTGLSIAPSASYATSASYAFNSNSSSYSLSGSYSDFAATAQTANDILVVGKNDNNNTITKGSVVRVSGANGANLLFDYADWSDDNVSANTIGFLTADTIKNNTGSIMTEGTLIGVNTNAFAAGDLLYLSSSGTVTNVKPIPPKHGVRLGYVLRSNQNNGVIYVSINNGYEIDELHDVLIPSSSVTSGDLLIRSGSLWINSKTLSGSYTLSGSLTTNDGIIANSITASLQGTSSWAQTSSIAITASYASNAGSSMTTGSTYPITSSWSQTSSVAITASYASNAGSSLSGGTTNYIPLWSGSSTLTSSVMYQKGSAIGIGSANPTNTLDVVGNISASVITASLLFGTSSWSTNTSTASALVTTNNYTVNNLTASNISSSGRLTSGTTTLKAVYIWHGGTQYYTEFANTNELNTYTAAGSGSTLYIQYRSGSVNLGAGALVVNKLTGGSGFTINSTGLLTGANISASYLQIGSSINIGNALTTASLQINTPASNSSSALIISQSLPISQSTALPIVDLYGYWSGSSTNVYTGIRANIIDSGSSTTSNLLDLQLTGSSRFFVDKYGFPSVTQPSVDNQPLIRIGTQFYIVQGSGPTWIFSRNTTTGTAGLMIAQRNATTPWVMTNPGGAFGWTATNTFSETGDTAIYRDTSSVIAQRLGGTFAAPVPQSYRIYNYYSASTDYERTSNYWSASNYYIATEFSGSGSARNITFVTSGSNRLFIGSNGNIGLGTINPLNKLDVAGNISASVITASLVFGTSSWSNNALTASYIGSGSNNYFPYWSNNTLVFNSLISQSTNQIAILSDTASFLTNTLVVNKSDPFYLNNNPTLDAGNSPNQTLMLTPNIMLGGNGNGENWNRFNSNGTVDFIAGKIKFTSGGTAAFQSSVTIGSSTLVNANTLDVIGNISANIITASLFSGSVTGSVYGTSSWANNTPTASYATYAETSSITLQLIPAKVLLMSVWG